jgi:hypothetical protein
MSGDDALTELAIQLGLALQPLVDGTSSDSATNTFLRHLGWDITPPPGVVTALHAPAAQIYELVDTDGDIDPAAVVSGVRAAFAAISAISSGGGVPPGFGNEFPRQVVDHLVYEYLLNQQWRWGWLLRILGIIRTVPEPATGTRPAFVREIVAWEDLGQLLSHPLDYLRDSYRWGDSGFRGLDLQLAAAQLAEAWGGRVRQAMLDPDIAEQLKTGQIAPTAGLDTVVRLILLQSESAVAMNAGVGLFVLPETATAKPGLAVLPYATAGLHDGIDLSDSLRLMFDGSVALDGGVGALVRPNADIQVLTGFTGAGNPTSASGTFSIGLRLGAAGEPTIVAGSGDASRFEVAGASALGGTRFHANGKNEIFFEVAVEGAKIVIKPAPGESDSFLTQLLPADGLSIGSDLTVGFSTTQGIYFGGSGGLEVNLPAHISLGPVEVQGAKIALRIKNGDIPIDFGATIKGDLSVLTAIVENVGMTATLSFPPDRKGNSGPANIALAFLAPKGVGLSIDAGVVKGGGYLYLDSAKGEYAGALELTVSDFLSLKAIALINTKLPDGGWSMLVIITAEFNPGFQLGFGFTLVGVGGLLGLNRGVLLEPLAAGVRTGAVNSILFPTNVIENAPRIISDLRAVFPPKPGTFLIGPMAKIGWGTPTLISVSLGVIIEIPGNVVILGRLKLALPTEDAALIVLQVTFMGALEFDKRRLWFFASLFESRILFITLDGELGMLMDYSDNPNFVLSVGGFHPRFTPPPLPFSAPNRLVLSIIDESFARIRIDTYLAVTTNTVQLGAHAEAYFGFSALSVQGHFGFDALIRFSPLYLTVEISCGFCVKVFGLGVWGIQLRGSLEGPTPWHISGSATISLLFFDIDVDIDETFGERRAEVLPPLPVLPALKAELVKLDTWRATVPASGRLLVSLREMDDPNQLVLHPIGTLQVSQRLIPLGLPLDKVGNQKPSDIKKATVTAAAGGLKVLGPMRERFAPAQFRNMDDAGKLSSPAFEMLQSGVELAADGDPWVTSRAAGRTVRYESIIVDTAHERFTALYFRFWTELFVHFTLGASVSRSALSLAKETKRKPFAEKVNVTTAGFVVANQADNTAFAASSFASHAEASAFLQSAMTADPSLADSIHVIPFAEVNAG